MSAQTLILPLNNRYSATSTQYNLFTGELEPLLTDVIPETGWLFDPDFGIVLPPDHAGREFRVDNGVSLAFPIHQEEMEAWADLTRPRQAIELKKPPGSVALPRSYSSPTEALPGTQLRPPPEAWVAHTEDAAQLILSGFGIFLAKKSERLQIKLAGKVAYEFPFFRISEVVVASRGVSLSSDLVKEFCERGIRLAFIESSGRPYAMLSSPALTATVASRRQQLLAYNDSRGLEFAKLVVRGKIRNQRHLLMYFSKYLKQTDVERHQAVTAVALKLRAFELQARKIEGAAIDERRQQLLGLEGVAGRMYWSAVEIIVESKAVFSGRVHQGATDGFNSLLNYGYGILYAHVWGAVVNAGLEPFAGYLHVDRPGKPSLVLDMVEEFRQPVVDRTVIAFLNLGQSLEMIEDGRLDDNTRKNFAQKILDRLASREPFRGQHYQIRSIIQMQARSFVSFLRGNGPYKPFSFRW